MAIVKVGSFTVVAGGSAQNLTLGFIPSYIKLINQTNIGTPANDEIVSAEWFSSMANGTGFAINYTGSAPAIEYNNVASNGFTPFQTGDASLYVATNKTITGITQAAAAVVTSTTHGLVTGDVVVFHGVQGMVQINTLTGVVTRIDANSFSVNINSTGFSAYTSGGIANLISNTTRNAGGIGLTLGSSLMTTTSDIWNYYALLDAPFTS